MALGRPERAVQRDRGLGLVGPLRDMEFPHPPLPDMDIQKARVFPWGLSVSSRVASLGDIDNMASVGDVPFRLVGHWLSA